MTAFLTMLHTGPCWASVLAAAFVHSSDRNTGWRSHTDHPEETNHMDSDILGKSGDKQATIIELKKYCIFFMLDVVYIIEWPFWNSSNYNHHCVSYLLHMLQCSCCGSSDVSMLEDKAPPFQSDSLPVWPAPFHSCSLNINMYRT